MGMKTEPLSNEKIRDAWQTAELINAAEFGYICCEKGMNIEEMKIRAQGVLNGK